MIFEIQKRGLALEAVFTHRGWTLLSYIVLAWRDQHLADSLVCIAKCAAGPVLYAGLTVSS
jgi:hypothetical protein